MPESPPICRPKKGTASRRNWPRCASSAKDEKWRGWAVVAEFIDAGYTVSTMEWPGLQGVVHRFEASDATVLLAETGTLNRGVTLNGAKHVLILNLEWSPETTLQAKDRCHRPGQTREVHVHYLLSSHTVDEQMYDLVDQKWAAQRAVQDREAQHKTVEAILAETALATRS